MMANQVLLGGSRCDPVLSGEIGVVDDDLADLHDGAVTVYWITATVALLDALRARCSRPSAPSKCVDELPRQAPGGR